MFVTRQNARVMHGKNSLTCVLTTVICGAIQVRNYYSWANEFAQGREWNYEESLDWFLLDENHGSLWHKGVLQLVKDLNGIYQKCNRSLN